MPALTKIRFSAKISKQAPIEKVPAGKRLLKMIDAKNFRAELSRIFGENGLGSMLSFGKADKLLALTEHLTAENEKYNLTAITDPIKIILNHYADSAAILKFIPKGSKIIDIGCGAGFPSLPAAILRDDLNITSIDSIAKRIEFVKSAAKICGLSNLRAECMRAEDGGKDTQMRERFDIAVSRAVAELRILSELALPYVKVGGCLIAMKGRNAENEARDAKRSISMLGGELKAVEKAEVRGGEEPLEHRAVIIYKKSKTPSAYPRPYAQISKKPL